MSDDLTPMNWSSTGCSSSFGRCIGKAVLAQKNRGAAMERALLTLRDPEGPDRQALALDVTASVSTTGGMAGGAKAALNLSDSLAAGLGPFRVELTIVHLSPIPPAFIGRRTENAGQSIAGDPAKPDLIDRTVSSGGAPLRLTPAMT